MFIYFSPPWRVLILNFSPTHTYQKIEESNFNPSLKTNTFFFWINKPRITINPAHAVEFVDWTWYDKRKFKSSHWWSEKPDNRLLFFVAEKNVFSTKSFIWQHIHLSQESNVQRWKQDICNLWKTHIAIYLFARV